ncbi:MAG: YggS family pyridoxal phosphate-dependent enzyme [Chlamydiales bacterium]
MLSWNFWMDYNSIRTALPEQVTLVVISKGRTLREIEEVYEAGARDFGENRIKEAEAKIAALPSDIRWHFIGPLQRNKVSKVVGRFHLIHSVDNVELACAISQKSSKDTSILLQANTSGELAKGGLSPEEWIRAFPEVHALPHLVIKGLMTMAPMTENKEIIRHCFAGLRRLQKQLGAPLPILSMGMSQDYPIAVEEGSTLVRIGTKIFS